VSVDVAPVGLGPSAADDGLGVDESEFAPACVEAAVCAWLDEQAVSASAAKENAASNAPGRVVMRSTDQQLP
jgi:hypothetical protein